MRQMQSWTALAVAALTLAPAPASAATVADTVGLRTELERAVAGFGGVAGISVRDLATGEGVSIRGGEPFPTASLIKVSVLVALLEEVRSGRARLDERVPLRPEERVGGSGVLKHMGAGFTLSLEDAAWLMIVLSDNTATNLLLDRIGIETAWRKMDALGLHGTRVYRKAFSSNATSPLPDSAARYGLGVTTPDETTALFALLHRGRAVSPAMDSLAIAMLRANQDASKLVRWLPGSIPVAHKSGDIERARSDCGILYTPAAPIALCVMTRENQDTRFAVDNPAHLLMGRIARAVFLHYNPTVALPPLPG